MSRRFSWSFIAPFFLALFLVLAPKVLASLLPAPTGYVNDFAEVLTSEQRGTLENSLKEYEQQTGNEIAVAIIKSLDGQDINDLAVKVFEEWKVGKKGKDNGILLLVAAQERKIRIEVGYGLEAYLTDGQAGEIIRDVIIPEFKKGNYYAGLNSGILVIEEKLGGGQQETPFPVFPINVPGPAFILIVVVYLLSFMARSKSIWLGGIMGTILGGVVGLVLSAWYWVVLLAVVTGGLGLLLDWILSRNYRLRKMAGKNTGWWGSWGGFSGGRGGGGFGGFGGGRSGGGGASGSW